MVPALPQAAKKQKQLATGGFHKEICFFRLISLSQNKEGKIFRSPFELKGYICI